MITAEQEKQVIDSVTADCIGCEKSAEVLGFEAGISIISILRILKDNGFTSKKPTCKPGLTDAAKQQRLQFCLEHCDWTLEDWKRVIWSDETLVIMGHRRGAVKIWSRNHEAVESTCIRRRWKGVQEFMFWASFSYDKKGPCHIYMQETAQEKKLAEKEVERMNQLREPDLKAEWELQTAIARIGLCSRPGRKPQWRFTQKDGKLVRKGKGGVDWYRYQKVCNSYILSC